MYPVIQELETVNLASPSAKDEIINILNTAGLTGVQIVTLPKEMQYIRLVAEPAERTADFLKYKPACLVENPMRASFANSSVFYGCIADNWMNSSIQAVAECSSLYRNHRYTPNTKGINKFVGSVWKSNRAIELVSLVHPNYVNFTSNNSYASEVVNQYRQMLIELSESQRTKYDALTSYFANKFTELIPSGEEYRYNMTAAFAQSMMLKYDGVLYPSVQTEGQLGLNVAIKSCTIDKEFYLTRTFDVVVYKYKDKITIGNKNTQANAICHALGISSLKELVG